MVETSWVVVWLLPECRKLQGLFSPHMAREGGGPDTCTVCCGRTSPSTGQPVGQWLPYIKWTSQFHACFQITWLALKPNLGCLHSQEINLISEWEARLISTFLISTFLHFTSCPTGLLSRQQKNSKGQNSQLAPVHSQGLSGCFSGPLIGRNTSSLSCAFDSAVRLSLI